MNAGQEQACGALMMSLPQAKLELIKYIHCLLTQNESRRILGYYYLRGLFCDNLQDQF